MSLLVAGLIQGRKVLEDVSLVGTLLSRILIRLLLMWVHIRLVSIKDHLIRAKDWLKFLASSLSLLTFVLFHNLISRFGLGLCLTWRRLEMETAWWSATPLVVWVSVVRSGLLVKKRSRMLRK